MESFSKDIQAILRELNQSEREADDIISSFKKGFDDVVQKYAQSKNTPVKPSKKKAKGRVERVDHDDSVSSTNSSRSTNTVTRITAMNDQHSADEEPALLRPTRTGRAKPTCYKEPPLNAKMRRDGTMTVVNIANVKTERTSTEARPEKTKGAEDKENEPERPVRIKKEKLDEPLKSTANKATIRANEITSSKKTNDDSNDSLEIVPMETNPTIELLSDEETSNDGNKMPPPAFVPPIKPIKEKKAPVEKKTSTRSTRSKQTKRKIKQEPMSESEDEGVSSASNTVNEVATEEKAVRPSRNASEKSKTNRPLNTSGESLYEDAMSQPLSGTTNRQQCNATFVTTVDEKEQLSPRGTYIIPKGADGIDGQNATFDVEQTAATTSTAPINNQTVVVATKTGARKASGSSIMTEDDSDSETGTRKHNGLRAKKDPKELFNPCTSKPIKQRVEAFEKLQTPQKETRTRTRIDSEKTKYLQSMLKTTTPSEQAAAKHARTNSATRYGQSAQKLPTLTKSQSVEEIRKKNQAVVDEKKKKQDDKLRKAQQAREAQEKEKAEKQRKLLQEKEQRAREKEKQKQQEELMRLQEQKRKEAEREQKRKEAQQAKKAAAERKEQEHYLRVLAEKKAMQEQLKLNKLKAEEQRKKNAYNFDMLESGDSTDDEGKTSNKRPMPPSWSTSQNRYAFVMAQARVSTKITDKFFSVAPHEVDLREIFPRIDEKYLRRNSSAVWNSPPRYSLLPKY